MLIVLISPTMRTALPFPYSWATSKESDTAFCRRTQIQVICALALKFVKLLATVIGNLGPVSLSLLAMAGSFWLTMCLTDTEVQSGSGIERLTSSTVFNRSDVIEAAISAGLSPSSHIDGRVEAMNRIDNRDVVIKGWMADQMGDGTPMTILIFVAGKKVASAQTRGERLDVTQGLHLKSGAEKNVVLEATFACPSRNKPVIVGLGIDERYFYMPSPACP
jgi:hypothetical protein